MDNAEKLVTQDTQEEERQNKDTKQYVLDTTMRKQAQITLIRQESSHKQLEVR